MLRASPNDISQSTFNSQQLSAMISSRAAFASLPPLSLPPPPIPHPPPLATPPVAPSPLRTPSRPIPRSPYVNISPQRPSRLDPDNASSFNNSPPPSSPVPLQDVLNEQQWVGPGCFLHGQRIRTVPIPTDSPPTCPRQPATCFEVVRKLGSGSYAVVYLVREIISPGTPPPPDDHQLAFGDDLELDVPESPLQAITYGREFAIKCLSKANLNRDALEAQLFEATVHQSLPVHPNIVTLHRTLETDSFLLLVLECVPGEDLFYFLEQARDHSDDLDLPPNEYPSVTPPTPSLLSSLHPSQLLSPNRLRLIASMFAQMCNAVASCHRVSVFHRDIKPENFIVTDGWALAPDGHRERRVVVKLTDFGLATNEPESADMDCGSAPYMSYECRNNCAPTYSTQAADVWSLGIVLINMLYHHNPWSDTTAGACPSFEFFRAQPVPFFMQRFTGMTREVAEFLATRVFCILDDAPAHTQRVTAAEFGQWVKHLPSTLAQSSTPAPAIRGHLNPVVPTPRSRRPSSRAGGDDSRPPSQRGMHIHLEGEFELAEPDLPEEDDGDVEACSRTTSTIRRRKRGARKGKGVHTPVTAPPDLLEDLAVASQVLAREISKTSKSSGASPLRTVAPPPPLPSPAKKPSIWKGVFRMNSADAIAVNTPPPVPFQVPQPPPAQPTPSATAHNVSTLIMGLSPAPPQPKAEQWNRGRRKEPRVRPAVGKAAQFERWGGEDKSPSRTGASSSNWRTSSSASSISGGTIASSAFTRFSNGSVRSVSTVATSVSATSSWRNPPPASARDEKEKLAPPPAKKPKPPLPPPPANLKIISGVPWELHELPRGCHVRPNEHVFAPPPVRYTAKAQARAQAAMGAALDTISERSNANKSPVYQRAESSSASDVTDPLAEGDTAATAAIAGGPKVQKGQIHALAKMLSALKANRAH